MKKLSALLLLPLFLSACLRHIAAHTVGGMLGKGAPAFYEESDVQFARESMGGELKLLEVMIKNSPNDPQLLLTAAQGFGGYAFLFLEDEDPGRATKMYERGRDYGLRALNRRCGTDILKKFDMTNFEKSLDKLKKK